MVVFKKMIVKSGIPANVKPTDKTNELMNH